MPAKSKKSLTVKERKLIKATAEGKNQTEAGLAADPNRQPETARVWANETLQKPTVKQALELALEERGLTPRSVVDVVADGMSAERIVTSPTEPDKEVPDHQTRLKAAGMAARFMGIDKQNDNSPQLHFHQHLESKKADYDL